MSEQYFVAYLYTTSNDRPDAVRLDSLDALAAFQASERWQDAWSLREVFCVSIVHEKSKKKSRQPRISRAQQCIHRSSPLPPSWLSKSTVTALPRKPVTPPRRL